MSIDCHACIGGVNVREDMAKLAEGPHVIVGTPGRVFDSKSGLACIVSRL